MKKRSLIRSPEKQYFAVIAILFILISILYNIQNYIGYETVSLILLFCITLFPLLGFGRGPIITAAFIGAMGWNYYFIPPHFTFHIDKPQDIMMNALFFIVAVVTGVLTARLKTQETVIHEREVRTNALNNLLKELAKAKSIDSVTSIAVKNIKQVFNYDSGFIYVTDDEKLSQTVNPSSSITIDPEEWIVAEWCFKTTEEAGKTTRILPDVDLWFLPLVGTRQVLGSVGLSIPDDETISKGVKIFLKEFIAQVASVVEREILSERAKKNYLLTESDKLYKNLFNSISHELRTPITSIMTAASSLQNENLADKKEIRNSLSREINQAGERLNRLVENLLDITRLESGQLKIKKDWNDINDLLNNVLKTFERESVTHIFKTRVELNNPLFKFDFVLLEQALINTIHNCIIYTPEGSVIEISIIEKRNNCIIQISDDGSGFPSETINHLFEKFYRGAGVKAGGTGLGLSIAKGFVEAHKGTMKAENKKPNGALFTLTIPMNSGNGTTEDINS